MAALYQSNKTAQPQLALQTPEYESAELIEDKNLTIDTKLTGEGALPAEEEKRELPGETTQEQDAELAGAEPSPTDNSNENSLKKEKGIKSVLIPTEAY